MAETSYSVSATQGLEAAFNQPSGPSCRGVDWAVRIEGSGTNIVVLVRTYFSSKQANRAERDELAQKAVQFVRDKLAAGWAPQKALLVVDDPA